jgi:hypothetical protein
MTSYQGASTNYVVSEKFNSQIPNIAIRKATLKKNLAKSDREILLSEINKNRLLIEKPTLFNIAINFRAVFIRFEHFIEILNISRLGQRKMIQQSREYFNALDNVHVNVENAGHDFLDFRFENDLQFSMIIIEF